MNLIDLFSKAITERRCLVTVVFLPFFPPLSLAHPRLSLPTSEESRVPSSQGNFLIYCVCCNVAIINHALFISIFITSLAALLWFRLMRKASPAHRTIQEEEEEKRNQGCLLSRVASAHRTHVHRAVVNYRIALRRAPAKGAIGAV